MSSSGEEEQSVSRKDPGSSSMEDLGTRESANSPAKRKTDNDYLPDSTKRLKIVEESSAAAGDGESDSQAKESSVPSDLSTGSNRGESDILDEDKKVENVAVADTATAVAAAATATGNALVVAEHYNSLKQKCLRQRSQSRIVYMRNFNNWIKSMLINEYLGKARQGKGHGAPFKVLDMCCGKGGDLLKWKKANITHLICADIADVSVEQCQSRYNDLLNRNSNNKGFAPVFSAEFITADCTRTRLREKFKDASCHLDLVSCQFAFHYSFETLPQAECMLRNAGESLRSGGYFIGTIPDANDLVHRWQSSDTNKFGNEVYNVEFQCTDKTKPPLFGAKYDFNLEGVVNCPEFLVHLPTLKKLAFKYGLELVMFERFEKFYERMKDEGRSLLGKMRAFETYPPCHDAPLLGQDPEDYKHAAQYMQNSSGHRKIGTLSLPEWEATSLYAVFAFQKMKTTWNADARPEYVKL